MYQYIDPVKYIPTYSANRVYPNSVDHNEYNGTFIQESGDRCIWVHVTCTALEFYLVGNW